VKDRKIDRQIGERPKDGISGVQYNNVFRGKQRDRKKDRKTDR